MTLTLIGEVRVVQLGSIQVGDNPSFDFCLIVIFKDLGLDFKPQAQKLGPSLKNPKLEIISELEQAR